MEFDDANQVVEIWTDGGCKPNPGPGGWAAILRFRDHLRELSGGEEQTTNNRMELTAAAEALEALKRPCSIILHTDSEYLKNGITRWHTGWVRKNWRNAAGEPVIPENSHARLAAPATNEGAQILRRGYTYDNGVSMTAERWPPWRQGMEFDAGLLFICYQRDPRTGFVKIFDKMAKFDMMNQFVTHVGGGLFACPSGAAAGGFIGQAMFQTT